MALVFGPELHLPLNHERQPFLELGGSPCFPADGPWGRAGWMEFRSVCVYDSDTRDAAGLPLIMLSLPLLPSAEPLRDS
jgi:hypothetical protein